jgi:hypothetical protein
LPRRVQPPDVPAKAYGDLTEAAWYLLPALARKSEVLCPLRDRVASCSGIVSQPVEMFRDRVTTGEQRHN